MEDKAAEKKMIERVENRLKELLKEEYPNVIYQAMNYSVNAGGKRLRPILLLSACDTVGGDMEDALDFACALEMIHTYSLIHDDLPAMDNDDFRWGKPTCHKVYGDGMAVLAGDGLLNKAYEIMFKIILEKKDERYMRAAQIISNAAGVKGMIGGQTADLEAEEKAADEKTLLYIHENKTAALIRAALKAGAIIGGADDETVEKLDKVGYDMGIAFQIKDDILDITSTAEVLGKPINSDEKNNKSTYITIFGMEKAQKDYEMLSCEACEIIKEISGDKPFLYEYSKRLIDRVK
ncbi:MAG: polyprenyl synthetase family protein [Firmicutes bacterium]|nr:polyprenyl synthetase family protein [Bacillota bacterium]